MSLARELSLRLQARSCLILVVSREEERVANLLAEACLEVNAGLVQWDVAGGFTTRMGPGLEANAPDPRKALEAIKASRQVKRAVFLPDFHDLWTNPQLKRMLKSLAHDLRQGRTTLVVTLPSRAIPEELVDEAVVLELPPPDRDELDKLLTAITSGCRVELTPLGRDKLLTAALGLTMAQARRVFAKAIVNDGVLDDRDIELVQQEKRQIIRESGALEFLPPLADAAWVGGLDVLKDWLRLRERAFTAEAREYGLPAPKGVALVGIPGTGKSLTAKMVAALWKVPLLRLDVGALFGGLMGQSEERTRQALALAETVAPCVLWIDEIEKATQANELGTGTTQRVIGTILTWMQEKTAPCFVVATANDVSKIPAELMRRGRFDELFFLDLPTHGERRQIFSVHLQQRHRLSADYDLERLAAASQGLVGAELEQAIIEAMYTAFHQDREFTTDDIVRALERLVPLSVSCRETVEYLRGWLQEGRAQSASFRENREASVNFVPLPSPFSSN